MARNDQSVAIRLGVVGDQEVEASLDRVGQSGDAATKRLIDGFQRVSDQAAAAADRATAAGQRIVASLNVTNTANAAPISVGSNADAQVKAYNAYLADQKRMAEALRNAIDPLRVAQAAYDRELQVAQSLLKSGNISEAEHANAVRLSTATFDRAKNSLNQLDGAHGRAGASGMILQHVVRSTTDSMAAGLPATMILGEQISRLGEAAALAGGGEGAMGKFGAFMAGPWGLAVNAAISVTAILAGKFFSGASAADQMAEHQKSLADIIDHTTGRVKEQSAALLLNQQIMSQHDAKAAQGTADSARNSILFHGGENRLDFATNTGAAGAQHQETRQDPRIQAALDAFEKSNNADALAKTVSAVGVATPALRSVTDEIVKQAAAFTTAARQVQQYQAQVRLLNGTARPGDRKLATGDFGADAPDLQLADAKAKLAAATNAQQRAQAQATITQIEARKAFADGQITLADYTRRMTEAESAIHGADAAHKALTKSQQEQARAARELAKLTEHMNELNLGPEILQMSKADKKAWAEDFDAIRKQVDEVQKERVAASAWAVQQDRSQRDVLAYTQLELATLGMTADKRQVLLDRLRAQEELQAHGVDIESDQARQILAGVAAQDAMNAALAKAATAMQAVRDFGGQLVDDLAAGRNIAKDLLAEFIKLAAVNPLKNLINGNSALPTLTSALGSLGSLFGGGSLLSSAQASSWASQNAAFAAHNASGSDYFGGGLTWLAENGPELVQLPRGSSVTPAPQTRQMMASNNNAPVHNHFHLEGAVVTEDLLAQMNAIGAGAATQGAYGGAALAEINRTKTARRRMR